MIMNTLAIPELTSTEYVFNYIHYLLCTVCSEQYTVQVWNITVSTTALKMT